MVNSLFRHVIYLICHCFLLHLIGLGTLLSPLVSSLFLDDSLEQIKNEKNSVTNLQKMFLSLQIFTISSSLLMLISGLFSTKDKLIYKENFESDANMEPLMVVVSQLMIFIHVKNLNSEL